jgi:transposase
VIRRPRLGCRACEGTVLQAPAPDRPIDGGLATEALVAHVVISKYCDHLPLYRQTRILARQGIVLDRSTLCDWVGRACWWLTPLYELILSTVLSSSVLFADDTTLPVLDPGRGRTKTGRLWCYAVDPRPWSGPGHPAAAYAFSEDRKAKHPEGHLRNFRGLLQTDGYNGFKDAGNLVTHALCWAHARRKFHDIVAGSKIPVPLAEEALRRIAELYAVESHVAGRPPDERLTIRREHSHRLTEALHVWTTGRLAQVPGGSNIAKAFRYVLSHWEGLTVFLRDGRAALDTNVVERQMRPVTLGRKNALFAGSDSGGRHWAILTTLIQTATLNDVDPQTWLTDVLERIVSGRTRQHELESLLPWRWTPLPPT